MTSLAFFSLFCQQKTPWNRQRYMNRECRLSGHRSKIRKFSETTAKDEKDRKDLHISPFCHNFAAKYKKKQLTNVATFRKNAYLCPVS